MRPELLTVEITESVGLETDPCVQSVVDQLGAFGCRVSIDDFGAGYSTFRYLRDIRVGEIKIDRSLVMDIEESHSARHILESVNRSSGCRNNRAGQPSSKGSKPKGKSI